MRASTLESLQIATDTLGGYFLAGQSIPPVPEDIETFAERGTRLGPSWLAVNVWADIREANTDDARAELACRQVNFAGWKGTCAYRVEVGIRVDAATSIGHVAFINFPEVMVSSEMQSLGPQDGKNCYDYLDCIARRAWLNREVLLPETGEEFFFGSTTAKASFSGSYSIVGPEEVRENIEMRQRDLGEDHTTPSLDPTRVATVEDVSEYRRGRELAYFQWLLESKPWLNWPTFVLTAHRRRVELVQ